jgi:hypothetical protein
MADPIRLEVVTDADTSDLDNLGQTLGDVAADGESMGAKIEDALNKAEDATRPTNSEFKALAKSLDDLAAASGKTKTEALDDLKRAAEEAGTELRQGTLDALERLASQGPRDVDKVRDAVDDLKRSLGDVGDSADDMAKGVDDGMDKAGDGLNDFKDEAAGTAREGAASFTGEFGDVGDIVQETLANALGGFGPIGAAAGIAAAAGFGTLYAKITEQSEKAEDRITAMYEDMLESQSKYLSKSFIVQEMEKIASGADDAIIGFEDLQRIADTAGVSLEEAATAYIGGGENLNKLLDQTSDKVKRNTELQTTGDLLSLQGNDENTRALIDRQKEIDKASDRMSKFNELGGRKLNKEIEMRDNSDQVDRRIDRAARDRKTDVDVDDRGTARRTQGAINELHGRDIPVGVYVDRQSINAVYNTVAGIRLPALTVQVRYGQAAV